MGCASSKEAAACRVRRLGIAGGAAGNFGAHQVARTGPLSCGTANRPPASPLPPTALAEQPPSVPPTKSANWVPQLAFASKMPPEVHAVLSDEAAAANSVNKAPRPEALCIKALHQLHDTGNDAEIYEGIRSVVELLRQTFQVDIAALSLNGVERQWFVAKSALELGSIDRQSAFASWALSTEHADMPTVEVVEDTLEDARFLHAAFVAGSPHLRFLARVPLMGAGGAAYGMLHIADRSPRTFAPAQLTILANYAVLCVHKLETSRGPELPQRVVAAPVGPGEQLKQDPGAVQEAVLLTNMETERWELRWCNSRFAELAGIPEESAAGRDIWSLFQIAEGDRQDVMVECDASIFLKQPFNVTVTRASTAGAAREGAPTGALLELRFRPASRGLPSSPRGIPLAGGPSFAASEVDGLRDRLTADLEHLFWAQATPVLPPGSTSRSAAPATMDAACAAAAAPVHEFGPGSGSTFSSASSRSSGCALAADVASAPERSRPSFTMSTSLGKLRTASFAVPTNLSDKAATFDKVKLGPLLGSGSYGRVYRGWWRGTGVAVKVMDFYCPPILPGNESFELSADKHSALLEAMLGREFTRHPCLVQTFDMCLKPVDPIDPDNPPQGPVRHVLWVVNELCNRGTLADAVSKGRFRLVPSVPASGPNMLSILLTAQDIAGGMSLLHDADILHSDLSSNNVLLKAAANSRRFTVAVSDFGLSRICSDAAGKRTQTVGTVMNQPPELLREGLLTPAADAYAFGVLLWTMYSGELPYSGDMPAMVIHRVVSGTRCPLELPADAPEGFKDLFERCVAYDRSVRPTFHQILDVLAPLVEKAEVEAPPASPRFGSPTPRRGACTCPNDDEQRGLAAAGDEN